MRYWIFLPVAILLYTFWAKADDYGVHLDQLTVDYARFKSDTRDPILWPDHPKERIDLGINLEFLKYGYFNNLVHSMTNESQFRLIGWYYQFGAHIGSYADVYIEHFSQHLLDTNTPAGYPVENCAGVKFYLYRRNR